MPSYLTVNHDMPQFFFDDSWIEYQQILTRRWIEARVFPEPVIVSDRPWEGPTVSLYGSIVKQADGEYRMYYLNWGAKKGSSTILLATSNDGLNWTKPINSKLRDELLNRELFLHIDELRYVADRWRMDYNHYRPHSNLDSMAPAVFAAKCLEQGSATLRLPQDKENTCEILS